MNSIFNKLVTGTAVLALSITVFASNSMAAETGVNAQITGTDLTLSVIEATAFDAVTLDGTIQTGTGALINSFNVTDARGTGAGWDVAVSSTQFTNPATTTVLSAGSLTLGAPNVTEGDGSSAASDIVSEGGNIDNDAATPVTILSAGTDEGMGSFTVDSIPMTLTLLPKEVYAGTYTSTVTVAFTAGP